MIFVYDTLILWYQRYSLLMPWWYPHCSLCSCFLLLWSWALCHEDNLVICLPGLCHRFCLSWILSFGRLFVKKWTQHCYRYANEWLEDIPSFSSLLLHIVVKALWAKEKGTWLILNCWVSYRGVPLIHKTVHEMLFEYLRTNSIKWEENRKYMRTSYFFFVIWQLLRQVYVSFLFANDRRDTTKGELH